LLSVKPSSQRTGGRIIFVSATIHYAGLQLQTHEVAAKAGIDALSNNAAIELGPLGVTSNVIAPGLIANTGVREPNKFTLD
jgi:peroxisomal 2,4-dienoyl-CoA reductase